LSGIAYVEVRLGQEREAHLGTSVWLGPGSVAMFSFVDYSCQSTFCLGQGCAFLSSLQSSGAHS
jgi:hypothetical protein